MQQISKTRCCGPAPAPARCCHRRPVVRVASQARDARAGAAGAPAVGPCVNNALPHHLSTTDVGCSTNIRWHESMVARKDKEMLLGQRGCVLWFTGLSGSGKSTVACTLEHLLHERGHFTSLLDGDNIRHGLNKDLGFSPQDRAENIRRIGEVARLFADAGAITMTSFISPYKADREMVRERCNAGEFLEVFMNIPLEVCEARDPKGLYKKARAGLIKNFTGIDDPYEAPEKPEIVVDCCDAQGVQRTPREMAEQVLDVLERMGYLRDPRMPTLTAYTALQRKHSDGVLDFAQL